MTTVTLRKSGNSLSFDFPEEIAATAHLRAGDTLHLSVVEGRIVLTPCVPDFTETMQAVEVGARRFRNAYAGLSKK